MVPEPLGGNVFRIALRDDPDVILIGEMRDQLSNMLQGIIAQSLVPRSDRKGRIAAVEVMLGTDAVKNHIRSNKIPQMETVMHGSTQLGMQTLTESLAKLYKTGRFPTKLRLNTATTAPKWRRSSFRASEAFFVFTNGSTYLLP